MGLKTRQAATALTLRKCSWIHLLFPSISRSEYSRSSTSCPGLTDGRAPTWEASQGSKIVRLGCGPPSSPLPRSHRLRTPRERIHRSAQLEREPGKARDLCRAYGDDSLSQGSRNYRGGTTSRPSVRSSRGQLLGLHDPQFLFTPP